MALHILQASRLESSALATELSISLQTMAERQHSAVLGEGVSGKTMPVHSRDDTTALHVTPSDAARTRPPRRGPARARTAGRPPDPARRRPGRTGGDALAATLSLPAPRRGRGGGPVGTGRDAAFDALAAGLGTALSADRTLGGLCDWVEAEAPRPVDLADRGRGGAEGRRHPDRAALRDRRPARLRAATARAWPAHVDTSSSLAGVVSEGTAC